MNPRPQRQCSILSRFSINMGSKEKAHKLRHFRNHSRASQGELVVRNLPANVGDVRDPGSVSGLERSPGGEHGNSLQYSYLDNPTDRGARWPTVHRVVRSQTLLK